MSICIKLHLLNLMMAALSTAHRLHCRIHRGSRIAQPILDEIRGTAGCPSGKKVCWYLQLSEQQDGRQHRPSAEENSPAATCPDILFALTLSPESKVHLSDKHGDSGGEGCRNSQWRDCRNKPRLWKSSPQWTATATRGLWARVGNALLDGCTFTKHWLQVAPFPSINACHLLDAKSTQAWSSQPMVLTPSYKVKVHWEEETTIFLAADDLSKPAPSLKEWYTKTTCKGWNICMSSDIFNRQILKLV